MTVSLTMTNEELKCTRCFVFEFFSHLLEVEIDDDIIEELSTVKALQVLHCHSDSTFQRWRRKLDQPERKE